jgi:hypothetical protein
VVEIGEAFTEEPVVVFNPVDGDHEKVVAPLAVNAAELPEQTDVFGDTVTLGSAFTVTETVLLAEHPIEFPVTVYVIEFPGVAITEEPVDTLRAI